MNKNIQEYLFSLRDEELSKPVTFNLSLESDLNIVLNLIENGKIKTTVDDYEEQKLELFGVLNPSKVYTSSFKEDFFSYYKNLQKEGEMYKDGKWVYYPWSYKIVHILDEDDFQLVRTARNKNLIKEEEQKNFYNACVAIGGLSVGSSVALALTLSGGVKHIKIADMDRLALSNTNRIVSGVDNLGILKVVMSARKIYEINPYAIVDIFENGVTKENIDDFFSGVNVMIDELDNIAVKYLIREKAKKYKIPVIMGTDNGDNAVVDIERYDLDENVKYFHERMGTDLTYESLLHLDKFGIGKKATQCVGVENVTIKMQESLLQMGKTIVSWPQLGGAALINGIAISYCVRKIVNNQSLQNNRVIISMDEKFIPEYFNEEEINKRKEAAETFKKVFNL